MNGMWIMAKYKGREEIELCNKIEMFPDPFDERVLEIKTLSRRYRFSSKRYDIDAMINDIKDALMKNKGYYIIDLGEALALDK